MKLSKILHVISIIAGLVGVVMSASAVLFWPAGVVWWGLTREIMLLCAITSLLAAIWIQIATIHHMMIEKRGEIV
ncbi:MAG: hypothetical protein Q8R26_02665 [bacterium]|nr:hypothetical protein [bacterium]